MFAVAGNDTYFTPVEVDIPDGTVKGAKHKFKVEFRRKSQDELTEIFRRLDTAKLEAGEVRLSDAELLLDVMVGWDGVNDKSGNPVAFNPESMEKLLNVFPVRPAIVNAFFESIQTGKRKN